MTYRSNQAFSLPDRVDAGGDCRHVGIRPISLALGAGFAHAGRSAMETPSNYHPSMPDTETGPGRAMKFFIGLLTVVYAGIAVVFGVGSLCLLGLASVEMWQAVAPGSGRRSPVVVRWPLRASD